MDGRRNINIFEYFERICQFFSGSEPLKQKTKKCMKLQQLVTINPISYHFSEQSQNKNEETKR